ncbi:MAG: zinc ribbon domain-containing protein [Rhodanobacteraceae bacterium]
MPIYEFECDSCSHRFERLQKLSDADPVDCPECGKPRLHRRLNAPAFRLAGAGWYETDFKKEGDTRRNLAGGDEPPKTDAKVDTPSEAKPVADKKPEKPAASSSGGESTSSAKTAAEKSTAAKPAASSSS